MTQLDLAADPDRERLLTDAAVVLGDLLLELGADWRRLGIVAPELGDQPPSALVATDYRHLPLVDRLRTWVVRHDLAQLDVRARPVVGAIGDFAPRRRGSVEVWHRRVLSAVARGEYPSGRAIRGSHTVGSLGLAERSYRAELLTDLGWVEVRRGDATARWVAPEGTLWWHAASPALQRARRRAVAAGGAQ